MNVANDRPDTDKEQQISLEKFAVRMMPGISVAGFHGSYYRILDAFAQRKVRRLIVTVPPQHGKSFGSSVLLPAYLLGLDPGLKVAIASYSASLANRFNKRVQRMIESPAYASAFPGTTIKRTGQSSPHIRTADHVEIIGHSGELMSVGREGSLTGNRVDVFILDDLYKDAMEANSPVIRENCWDWYVSVVRTRMHNDSSELIVFTRWHKEDLIGILTEKEDTVVLERWEQIDLLGPDQWLLVNFEAIKESAPTEVDPRAVGEPLWEERHSAKLLTDRCALDPRQFQCMYQGKPSNPGGLLYGDGFGTYTTLPGDIVRYANYTDTADTGDDYLCSVCYAVDPSGVIYVTDIVYSCERMEVTEKLVADMAAAYPSCEVLVESNNGGRGFARAVSRLQPRLSVRWFHQSANKEARILSNSSAVMRNIVMPADWKRRWPQFAAHVTTYQRSFRVNRWHDAPDVLTGMVEREFSDTFQKKIHAMTFSR